MTNSDSSSPNHQAKGPTRLQLQAACVKAGLDSTPENDDLKKALQKYWDENNQAERFPLEVDEEHEKNETSVPTVAIATTAASLEITSTIITTSTEETQSQDNSKDGPTEKELDAEEIAVKLEVKLEDSIEQEVVVKEESVNIQEPAKNDSESTSYPTASATNEDIQVKKETLFEEATETTIKQEEDVAVKEEEAHPEEKSLLQYDDDIKPEDIPAVPVSERAQFWESKASTTTPTTTTTTTSAPRSNLPVSKTRLASSQKSTSKATAQKRKTEEDVEVKKESADNTKAESPSSSLPTPGTVRKMIGRFANSGLKRSPAAEPSVVPTSPSKKRRVDSPSTPSTPTSGPSTLNPSTPTPTTPSKHSALKNKVVKIPVATSAKAKNVYATPRVVGTPTIKKSTTPTPKASETGKAMALRRQNAIVEAVSEGRPARRTSARLAAAPLASSSTTSTSTNTITTTTTTTTSKSVSAETINRLATPKKVNVPVLTSTTTPASFAASVGPATPTRPRGPVLSTASRAAQRSHRKKD
ncbi:hypothetical protein BG006_006752 [Podila minutissima]|uniref:Uncharacterized protein n=1 Tax=Podila minutissima TaxID=64525 RepID=A0A9P5SI72_9FUNG|nr:hypothetical protein BG006_006752 [Podila minutissima]